MSSLSHRKQYAKKCLINNNTSNRGFDNCFENGDADQVVKYLLAQCDLSEAEEKLLELYRSGAFNGVKFRVGDDLHKTLKKLVDREALRTAIKARGLWDSWLYYMQHGTYKGFKGASA